MTLVGLPRARRFLNDHLAQIRATGVRSPTMTRAKTALTRNDPRDPAQQQTVNVSPDDHPLYDLVTNELGFRPDDNLQADDNLRTQSHAYKTTATADLGTGNDKADPNDRGTEDHGALTDATPDQGDTPHGDTDDQAEGDNQ